MMTIATQFGASAFTQHCCALRRLRQAPRRWAATPVALSPEQQQYAMEKQLRLSQEREAAAVERKTAQAAAQAAAAADAEAPTPGRKPTRRELRGARRAAAKEVTNTSAGVLRLIGKQHISGQQLRAWPGLLPARVQAEAAAQQQSAAAQSELAARLGPLDEHALSSALRVQLRQSGTFDEVGGAGRGGVA
jgi:hypothetical protein